MGKYFFLFLVVLVVVAIATKESFVLTLLYLLVGTFLLGRWWGRQALKGVVVRRAYTGHAFLGEKVRVRLHVQNTGWLPLAWMRVRESLPVELFSSGPYQRVVTVSPKSEMSLEYWLDCRKRGYYPLGPLDLSSGDVLGAGGTHWRSEPVEFLTVYPKIIPLRQVKLPSQAPLGTLRHNQPIFEDPSRIWGKRDYVAGDSLRRVDWKSSANIGRLQVKLFEPSIALETTIFLNLNAGDYEMRTRYDVPELAIVVAASLASWVINVRQAVGLATNGIDPLLGEAPPPPLPPRRGRSHLLRLLETLARIQVEETYSLADLLQQESHSLAWGTTLVVVTNRIDDALFDSLFATRRAGLNAFLIQCGPTLNFDQVRRRANYFGFPIHQVLDERDLDIWRK
ncbi:MAG: DUF58 domain-containing protein [Chloroflexota bacterium]